MVRNIILTLLFCAVTCERFTYDNYKVFSVPIKSKSQAENVHALCNHYSEISIWKEPNFDKTFHLMVSPSKLPSFLNHMNSNNFTYKTIISNVQNLIENEKPVFRTSGFGWHRYHTLDEIYNYLDSLADVYPDKAEVIVGGRSYEGRQIKGVKLFAAPNKPRVYIEGGIHAREWISPATVTYIISQLLSSSDEKVKALGEDYEFHIFPSVNPDGYVFSHTTQRLWRKNRRPYSRYCFGVDLNRNFNDSWMVVGASDYPCSEVYAGPSPFSEIETQSISNYMTSIKDNLSAVLTFHSYSQLLLFPYGSSNNKVDNYDDLLSIGKKAAETLKKRYGTSYKVGSQSELIYEASGNTHDWTKQVLKVPLVFSYELRDTGNHGFLLPPEQIIPTGEETLDSLVAMFAEAKKHGYFNN